MCRNCEDGMATECWDARLSTKLPDVDFYYQPRFTPPVDLTSYVTGVSIGRLSASVQKTVDKKWEDLLAKETGMSVDREQAEISRRFREALELDAVQAEVQRRVNIMNDYDADTWKVGTVFTFARTFGDGSKVYHYAALKCANGKWYLTGNGGVGLGGLSWRELLAWLVGHPTANVVTAADIMVANGWGSFHDVRSSQ